MCARVQQRQPLGMQQVVRHRLAAPHGRPAIARIADQWMAEVRQVQPDLVCAAGLGEGMQERCIFDAPHDLETRVHSFDARTVDQHAVNLIDRVNAK